MEIKTAFKGGAGAGYAELLGIKKDIVQMKIAELVPYANEQGERQPFKPYTADKLSELAEDIKENGIISPIIVREIVVDVGEKMNDTVKNYQILAGHNRVNAAKLIGLEAVPAIIKDVDDNEAAIIMVNTNLNQRQKLLHSEKAFAYKMQMDAIRRKAGRPAKNNSRPLGENYSVDVLSENSNDSARNIHRYIRLTYLFPPLLDLVDTERLPFRAGVILSYIPLEEQQYIFAFIRDENVKKVSLDQAEKLRILSDTKGISYDTDEDIEVLFGKLRKAEKTTAEKAFSPHKYFTRLVKNIIPDTATDTDIDAIAEMINRYFTGEEKENE